MSNKPSMNWIWATIMAVAVVILMIVSARAHGVPVHRGHSGQGRAFHGNVNVLDPNGNQGAPIGGDQPHIQWNAAPGRIAPWERGCTKFDDKGRWRDVC